MSVDKFRSALGRIQDNPDDPDAWDQLQEVVTGDAGADLVREFELARVKHEQLQLWPVVAKLLELEIVLDDEPNVAAAKRIELGRIYHEELLRDDEALRAFEDGMQVRPDDEKARTAVGEIEFGRANLESTVEHALVEALDSDDPKVRIPMFLRAAEAKFRYAPHDDKTIGEVAEYLKKALESNGADLRALRLASVVYRDTEQWEKLAQVLEERSMRGKSRDDRIAAAHQLCLILKHKLDQEARLVDAHQALFDLDPTSQLALSFLVDHYSRAEDWDHLAALYEDQLKSGAVKQSDELGVWVQLANINYKTRKRPDEAEPWFDKIRRIDPTNAGMLQFFRDLCRERGDLARLMNILGDATRATEDRTEKAKLQEEIALLAKGQENAGKAIEQYKAILRNDADNAEARTKLKELYLETESYNALVELYRQDLGRVGNDDSPAKKLILWDIARIYRDRMDSDTALLTVLTQILQIDDNDIEAVRGLIRVYESLGRWRDLLSMQQKLAELTSNQTEKVNLLRAVARRWMDQFSNVQHAMSAYESLLAATGDDIEAREKLRDLYKKRRAWSKLYELYESQLESMDGPLRTELMLEMSKLAAERLDKGDDAIRLLKEVLVFDAKAEGVLDQLERLAERQKDFQTVAYVLERRVEGADSDQTKAQLLQKLGALYAEKLENHEQSQKAWRRVLELSPGHQRALRVLRQSFVTIADWQGLEELYASQNDYEGLADFLSTTADKSKDDDERVALSFRAASVYESKLAAPERAARSYERVLSIDANNVHAAKALLPIYDAEEKWTRLPALYQVLLDANQDTNEKIAILEKIAHITGGPLANKAAALQYARQAYELRPDDGGLEALRGWSQQAGEWSAFIDVVTKRLETGKLKANKKRELELMLASVYANEVEKLDEAVAIYRSLLEANPTDVEVARELEGLLRAADRRDDLRWLFELRVERFEGDERAVALEEWATVEEEVFGEPARAVELLGRVVAADATRATALASLTRMLLAADDYRAAADTITKHRDVASGSERLDLETSLARIELEHLGAPGNAYEACARALEIEPDHTPVVAILEKLLLLPDTRARSAESLERIYARTNRSEKQVGALRALLETVEDRERRLVLCVRLADVEQHDLHDSAAAFTVILNTLVEAPEEIALWDRAAELATRAGRPTDLAEAYRTHLTEVPADAPPLAKNLVLDLCERAAVLHEEQLGDAEGAIPYLERMLTLEPTNAPAFGRLKAIYTAVEWWKELEDLYKSTIDVTGDDAGRVELLLETARLAEELIGDDDKAIDYFERILDIEEMHVAATDALEKLYGRRERWDKLAALLERRLKTSSDDDAPELLMDLIELYVHKLERYERVEAHLEQLVGLKRGDLNARDLAETCLAVPQLRQATAALLDGVYEGADDPRNLVRILDIRLEGAVDEDARRGLLRRLATLRDQRLKDDAGAFDVLSALLPLEPDDASLRERMLEVGRRLGEHQRLADTLVASAAKATEPTVRGATLMEAAALYRDRLENAERAEEVYRQVLTIDPDDAELVIPAAKALAEIYHERTEHQQLADVLAVQVRLESDVEEKRELYARIANLHEDLLENDAKAIEAWKARLHDNAADTTSLAALERLYERGKAWRDLVGILKQLEEAAVDGDERKRCMIKGAEVLSDELGESSEAIDAWQAVRDDFGPETQTLAALAKLYKLAERWQELADVYDLWLSESEDVDERVELWAGLGDVRREHLADAQGALAAYREVLTLQPSHKPSRNALEGMLGHEAPEVKREAAEIIGPLYDADGDAERLLKVLDIEIEATFSPADKLGTLDRALRTSESTLGDTNRAFDYARRGVREAVSEPSLHDWIATAERFAAETGRFADLIELYESVLADVVDADVQQSTRLRAGELSHGRLEDAARAIGHYRKALDARPEDERAMVALEELYQGTGDNPALLGILQMRAEAAPDDRARAALLYRVAELQSEALEDKGAAIATYESLVELSLDDKAVAALEDLYARTERWEDLVRLHERRLDGDIGDGAADIRVKIATVAYARLSDPQRALDELGEALEVVSSHKGAIVELERLLDKIEDAEQRGRVAEMLEPVYLAAHDWPKLRRALEARLDTTRDPTDRGELLTRLATLHEEQLEDYGAALETVAKRLYDEPTDSAVQQEVERLGRVLGDGHERRVAEIFAKALGQVSVDDPTTAALSARTGELFAAVGQHEAALGWYRRAHDFTPDSAELFAAIDGLFVKLERHEERVTHYRQGLDQTFEDDVRVRYLHVIAALQRDELDRDEEAIGTLSEVLDIRQDDGPALDALTKLYKKAENLDDLADLYERRAEIATDPEQAAPYRLELARLLAKNANSRDRALDQLEAIVADLPWHEAAIAELEALVVDEAQKQRALDALRPLYERSENWRGLIKLNDERLLLMDVASDKVDVLMDTARLWEDQGQEPAKAFAVVREAFALMPENEETYGAMARLAEQLGGWEPLAKSIESAANSVEDAFVKRQLYSTLATVYDGRLDHPRRALDALGKLSDLEPSESEPLERMDTLCVLLADWPRLVTVLERLAENAVSDDERADILRRLGGVRRDMLNDEQGAIATYEQALEIAPESIATLDRLIALYEERDAARLVALLEQRIEHTASDAPEAEEQRHALILQAADVYTKRLENRLEGIRMLQLALDTRPTELPVLVTLEKLYELEEMYDALLENLKTQASVAEDQETRRGLRSKIGDLYLAQFDNPFDALEQFRLVLDDTPGDEHAISALRSIGDKYDEQRLEVANLLAPVLTAASRHQELVQVLELRFSAQTDPVERAQTLSNMALIYEEQLDDDDKAQATLLRGLKETPDASSLHDDIHRLSELSGSFEAYADALAERAEAIFDADVRTDLFTRLGRIAEERLEDAPRAIKAYNQAVEHAGDPSELLEALDRLYAKASNHEELARVLERRIELATDDAARAELHYRLGTLQVVHMGDKHSGLATLRLAADLDPSHAGARSELEKLTDVEELFEEVAEALDAMYRVAQDNAARARLRNKRISYAPSAAERVRLRLELAQMLEDESFDTASAQDVVQQAFLDDPSDPELLAQLERLAATNADGELGKNAWRKAADAVGDAVVKCLAVDDEGEPIAKELARDLFLRTAGWYKDKAEDAALAEKRLLQALEQDAESTDALLGVEELHRAAGRERDLVGTLRRLATLVDTTGASVEKSSQELRREAKTLAETPLGDAKLAEEILRDMLKADEADVWALAELSGVVEKKESYAELSSLLSRRIELLQSGGSADPGELRKLRHQAAAVSADKLDDPKAAIDLYEQAFEDDPRDAVASTALRSLYENNERYEDLLRLIGRLIDLTDAAADRAELRLESARICIDTLETPTEGIDHLHAVLDEVPGHVGAVELLAKLLEKEQRDDELADLLGKQIELAKKQGERDKELGFRVKLAELYESRMNDLERAIEGYLAVLGADEGFRPALEALARLYEQQGASAKAAEMCEKLIGGAGERDGARLALKARDLFVAASDKEAASGVLERALDAGNIARDRVGELRDALRVLYRERGAWGHLAELLTKEATEADSNAEKVIKYRQAAEIHSAQREDHAAAADLLQKALDLKADDRDLMLVLCDEYTKSGRGKAAIEVLNKVVESYSGRRAKELADIHHRIATAHLAGDDEEAALHELEAARKMDPGAVAILHELGTLSLKMADSASDKTVGEEHVKRARNAYQSLLLQRLEADSPVTKADVFYSLAEVSKREGDSKKAMQMADRALANDKGHEKAKKLLEDLKG